MQRRFVPFTAALVVGLAAPAVASAAMPAPVIVHIKMYAFIPAKLTVPAGTTVTFVNDDDEPHTATATNHSFDSEAIDTNKRWQHTFAKAGSFPYFCEIHPQMRALLTVTGAAK